MVYTVGICEVLSFSLLPVAVLINLFLLLCFPSFTVCSCFPFYFFVEQWYLFLFILDVIACEVLATDVSKINVNANNKNVGSCVKTASVCMLG